MWHHHDEMWSYLTQIHSGDFSLKKDLGGQDKEDKWYTGTGLFFVYLWLKVELKWQKGKLKI